MFCVAEITCPKPRENTNLKIWNPRETYDYGDDIYYACPLGFVLQGPMSIKCVKDAGTRGKWNNPPPTCECKYKLSGNESDLYCL